MRPLDSAHVACWGRSPLGDKFLATAERANHKFTLYTCIRHASIHTAAEWLAKRAGVCSDKGSPRVVVLDLRRERWGYAAPHCP